MKPIKLLPLILGFVGCLSIFFGVFVLIRVSAYPIFPFPLLSGLYVAQQILNGLVFLVLAYNWSKGEKWLSYTAFIAFLILIFSIILTYFYNNDGLFSSRPPIFLTRSVSPQAIFFYSFINIILFGLLVKGKQLFKYKDGILLFISLLFALPLGPGILVIAPTAPVLFFWAMASLNNADVLGAIMLVSPLFVFPLLRFVTRKLEIKYGLFYVIWITYLIWAYTIFILLPNSF